MSLPKYLIGNLKLNIFKIDVLIYYHKSAISEVFLISIIGEEILLVSYTKSLHLSFIHTPNPNPSASTFSLSYFQNTVYLESYHLSSPPLPVLWSFIIALVF